MALELFLSTLELFFEMAESVSWRDEEVIRNVAFHVMTGSEIQDMTGHGWQSHKKKNKGNKSYKTSLLQRQNTRLDTTQPKLYSLLVIFHFFVTYFGS